MRAVLAAVSLLIVTAPVAHAATATVPDEVGEILPGPEISDIVEANVTYSAKRLSISVTHREWRSEWGRKRAATGGVVTFGNGRSFVIIPNMAGRRSLLYARKDFGNCQDGTSCALPCDGWRYRVDQEARTTQVSVPVRCFGTRSPRVKVRALHAVPQYGQQPVVDPIDTSPWVAKG